MNRPLKLSTVSYSAVLAIFALPFLMVSCDGQEVVTFSGYELAFGVEFQSLTVHPYISMILTLLAAVGAAVASLIGHRRASRWLGIAGIAFVIYSFLQFSVELQREYEGAARADMRAGFWLTLLAFLGGILAPNLLERYKASATSSPSSAKTLPKSTWQEVALPRPPVAASPVDDGNGPPKGDD